MLYNIDKKISLSIIDGKVTQRVKKNTPCAEPRTKKDGEVVWEIKTDAVRGIIDGISIRVGDYGKEWIISIHDVDEKYSLYLPYSSRHAKALLCALPNVDLTKEVSLVPFERWKDEKRRIGLFVLQNDKPVKWHYTKEQPNGLPPMEQIMINGEERWDDSKQLAFLEIETAKLFEKNQQEEPTAEHITKPIVCAEPNDDLSF